MLNLDELTESKVVQVPVSEGRFQYNKKKYSVRDKSIEGWYNVKIQGNEAKALDRVYDFNCLEGRYKPSKGYTYNNSLVFQNFDSAKRKWKFEIQIPLEFNNAQTFSAIKAIVWEDKRAYFTQPDYSNFKIFEIKTSYDNDVSIDILKGITPELRTLFLFHEIERNQIREMERQRIEMERMVLAEEDRKKREEEMMRTIPGRLQVTFERAGARLLNYSISGNRIVVDWKMPGIRHNYNSVIDARTFKILEAGYCMSNDDKKHNITSMVKLAEDYEERSLTHITRN